MALTTPTIKEINDNIIAQLELKLGQTIPFLPKAFERVLAKTLAAVFITLFKYGGFLSLQYFVKTATIEATEINGKMVRPLIEWGRLIGIGDPTPATNAQLDVEVTVENQTGFLPANSQLVYGPTGVTYITVAAVALDAPTKTVTIKAIGDQSGGNGSGAIGNQPALAGNSDVLSFANPLANVARDVTVTAQVVTGTDGETEKNYRQRVVDRFQKRPQGGAYADYEAWAKSVAGIVNAYPYTSQTCGGQVDVFVEATEASSGSADGIPTNTQLQEVLDAIELDNNGLASRRPANALVNTFAITRTAFTVEVLGLNVDNQAQIEQDIEASLTSYFLERAPFITGLTVGGRKDRITITGVSGVVEDIVTAANGIFSGVTVEQGGSPLVGGVYVLQNGEKAKLDTVSFP